MRSLIRRSIRLFEILVRSRGDRSHHLVARLEVGIAHNDVVPC